MAGSLNGAVLPTERSIQTPVLNIGFEETGNPSGFPIILLHGFPDDVQAYDEVAPPLAAAGYRVLVPYLRGYGPTRFRDAAAPRMAEQAAIGQDVIDFADALGSPRFAVAGYDWGGRAACIAAALHPDRVRAAVLVGGYSIQNVVRRRRGPPRRRPRRRLWYQWYFNTERGRRGLAANRRALCKLLWQAVVADVALHRRDVRPDRRVVRQPRLRGLRDPLVSAPQPQRAGRAALRGHGTPAGPRPRIDVPTMLLYGADDIVRPAPEASPAELGQFTKLIGRRVVPGAGHFLPREKPEAVSSAMLELLEPKVVQAFRPAPTRQG